MRYALCCHVMWSSTELPCGSLVHAYCVLQITWQVRVWVWRAISCFLKQPIEIKLSRARYMYATCNLNSPFDLALQTLMPLSYSENLHWRVVWLYLYKEVTAADIAHFSMLSISGPLGKSENATKLMVQHVFCQSMKNSSLSIRCYHHQVFIWVSYSSNYHSLQGTGYMNQPFGDIWGG